MSSTRKTVSIKDFPISLWREVKALAALKGLTIAELGRKVFRDFVNSQKREED